MKKQFSEHLELRTKETGLAKSRAILDTIYECILQMAADIHYEMGEPNFNTVQVFYSEADYKSPLTTKTIVAVKMQADMPEGKDDEDLSKDEI